MDSAERDLFESKSFSKDLLWKVLKELIELEDEGEFTTELYEAYAFFRNTRQRLEKGELKLGIVETTLLYTILIDLDNKDSRRIYLQVKDNSVIIETDFDIIINDEKLWVGRNKNLLEKLFNQIETLLLEECDIEILNETIEVLCNAISRLANMPMIEDAIKVTWDKVITCLDKIINLIEQKQELSPGLLSLKLEILTKSHWRDFRFERFFIETAVFNENYYANALKSMALQLDLFLKIYNEFGDIEPDNRFSMSRKFYDTTALDHGRSIAEEIFKYITYLEVYEIKYDLLNLIPIKNLEKLLNHVFDGILKPSTIKGFVIFLNKMGYRELAVKYAHICIEEMKESGSSVDFNIFEDLVENKKAEEFYDKTIRKIQSLL